MAILSQMGCLFDPILSPSLERIQSLSQRKALFCQSILNPDRHLVDDSAVDDPFLDQFLKPFGQESIADPRDGLLDFTIPQPSLEQDPDNQSRPAFAEQQKGLFKPGANWVQIWLSHDHCLPPAGEICQAGVLSTHILYLTDNKYAERKRLPKFLYNEKNDHR